MKSIILSAFLFLSVFTFSCNGTAEKNEHEGHDTTTATTPAPAPAADHASASGSEMKTLAVVYKDVDASAAATLKTIVDKYLQLKNALYAENAKDASAAANALVDAAKKLDKSLLSAEQKSTYDGIESSLKDHAGAIGKATELTAQREHFDELSGAVYELAKAFGAGRTVYHDHCPMANNNQGAMWISENKEITNPYFGSAMPNCGTVQEEIR